MSETLVHWVYFVVGAALGFMIGFILRPSKAEEIAWRKQCFELGVQIGARNPIMRKERE